MHLLTRKFACRKWLFLVAASLLSAGPGWSAQARVAGPLRLVLPPVLYAVPGVETNIYYDNLVLTPNPEDYRFEFQTPLGKSEPRRWTFTPEPQHVGEHRLAVRVLEAKGRQLATAPCTLRVVPADAGANRPLRVLIVGDSLTHASLYPKELVRLFSLPGNPQLTLLGTHRPASAAPGVVHEGYGGWTWARFNTHFDPKADASSKTPSSPFLFPDAAGQPQLDVARYVHQRCDDRPPDVVLFLLGINDCFGANPDDPRAIDASIQSMFVQAERLLLAFHKAAPKATLGVCLTTPPNARESGFEANYKGKYHRWGWKRIQHQIVERQLAQFSARQRDRIFAVPTNLNLDPVDGYPENNGVHPNESGYRQVAASMYAWLKNYSNDAEREPTRP